MIRDGLKSYCIITKSLFSLSLIWTAKLFRVYDLGKRKHPSPSPRQPWLISKIRLGWVAGEACYMFLGLGIRDMFAAYVGGWEDLMHALNVEFFITLTGGGCINTQKL